MRPLVSVCAAGVLIVVALFLAPGVQAQAALSTIRGIVTDATGGVVPGVVVVVTEVSTNVQARSVVSDVRGNYEIPDVKPGTYRLTAEMSGFKSFVADGVLLDSGQVRRLDINLQIGDAAEHVTVKSGAAVITTDTGTVSEAVTSLQYENAPYVDSATPYPGWQSLLSTLPCVVGRSSASVVVIAGQQGMGITLQDDGVKNDRSGVQ
jgi:hypothetical protein